MNYEPVVVSKILRILVKWNEVQFKEIQRDKAAKLVDYMLTRRTRFYYTDEEEPILKKSINTKESKEKKKLKKLEAYKRKLSLCSEYKKDIRKINKERGLCSRCGLEKESFKFLMCKKCREYYRMFYYKSKNQH